MRENGKGKQHIWRKARDALRLKLGDIQPTRLAARSIPYLIIFYLVDKEAWLYRHCIGGSAFDRVLAVLMNFGLPFENLLPSFHPIDLMTGMTGAAVLWAVVTYRTKNAKKYRPGEEYGSARWSA